MSESNLQTRAEVSHRIALLLTGDARAARWIVSWLVERYSSKLDDEALDAWFRHHTVLRAREVKSIGKDGVFSSTGDIQRDAFAKAVAGLPHQQREAWLLATIEGWPMRLVGASMDLSQTAAMNHLNAAKKQLGSLVGESSALEAKMIEIHRATTMPGGLTEKALARRVRRRTFRRIKQIFILLLAIAFCFGCLYVLKLSGQLVPFFEFVQRQF